MTSSFINKKLDDHSGKWSFALPNSPLGGLEDSHIKITGKCHPDFVTVPIGNRYGTKMCVRKVDPRSLNKCGTIERIGDPLHKISKQKIEQGQGYHRASVNLYDPMANIPTQEWNPVFYSDRRIPWDADLLRDDYLHYPLDFNGTGINTLRTPMELRDKNIRYLEYQYGFTPKEDELTGKRIATSFDQTVPPVKWDITRPYSPYNTFKREHSYLKNPQDFRDTIYFSRIV